MVFSLAKAPSHGTFNCLVSHHMDMALLGFEAFAAGRVANPNGGYQP
jgi:hypothetical protein